ncbi:hypothetical protein RRU01S_13_00740 [Agrobacterium rubi TR3 = NBRC 13261]|uniref:Fe-S protein n=1 Tax=Agrobacterium rubi TR3 = NBRC 13261 TaxID=1368415 RepID=A0A081CVP0_9HYPH|nr:DUF1289 domain-containing protein [Agrobacterium rubi]MBP1877699.1 putative Fe-S protein YdhL (DUF1289 family) [Agrobacterium rubi]MCL6652109.1 hypothetical protein [Agrobacterium rubi]GAK70736.1 hypothetical protein RRU01S_13_00740 [Agrobacterium rubi TR3 = NBRC 13261]
METPCINICTLDPDDGLCVGCYRTIEEIMGWSGYGDAARSAIMAELAQRTSQRHAKNTGETDTV